MSEQSTIHYQRTSPQAAKITFVNPPVNLIVGETVQRLTEIVEELAADPDIQVVVFDSATPDFFYNHFDLAAAADFPAPDDDDAVPVWTNLVLALSKAPYITIAAIRGRTRGGGNEFALALDLRYASREKAIFGQPEVGSGLLPGGGGTERLPRTIGRDRALEVILTSDDYDAETAERWGWVTRALPDSELDAFVAAVVARLASFDRTSLAAAKAQINRASLPPDADLVAAYSEFAHSLTLPGFLARAAGTQAIVEQAGIDFEYRLGEYIGIANQQRLCPTRNEHGRSGSHGSARLLLEPGQERGWENERRHIRARTAAIVLIAGHNQGLLPEDSVMSLASQPVGRRERNKQDKLDRIRAAASELFALHGVDEVTTQQIADKADIGAGTLFLYAKTKGELLLLVQNAAYVEALERGRADAEATSGALDAVLAIVRPIVECNRTHIDNGRTYLREMVFGDPEEPRHREALAIAAQTEEAIAAVLRRDERIGAGSAATLARVVSAVIFLSMAASVNAALNVEEIMHDIQGQVGVLLPR
jgi:enoyl-CoA hydratase/carnithine racemase/AcrR family transcriptional regulator